MKGIRTDAFDKLIRNKFEGKTMSEQTPVSKTIYNYPPKDVEGFDSLAELGPGYALVLESRHRPSVAAA